jgi:hypothetical protein
MKETTKIQKKHKIWTGLTAQKLENTREENKKKRDRPHRSTNGARAPIADACIAEAFYRGQQTTRQLF